MCFELSNAEMVGCAQKNQKQRIMDHVMPLLFVGHYVMWFLKMREFLKTFLPQSSKVSVLRARKLSTTLCSPVAETLFFDCVKGDGSYSRNISS